MGVDGGEDLEATLDKLRRGMLHLCPTSGLLLPIPLLLGDASQANCRQTSGKLVWPQEFQKGAEAKLICYNKQEGRFIVQWCLNITQDRQNK